MKTRVGVIDYGMGNLHSVSKALALQGASVVVSDSRSLLKTADLLVLPGVGAFGAAMVTLAQKKLDDFVRRWIDEGKPYLGICLGFQLLFDRSEESRRSRGLGVIPGTVVRFREKDLKKDQQIPHMGWNTAVPVKKEERRLFDGIQPSDYFYFVHSYFPVPSDPSWIMTETPYGSRFCSSVLKGNLFASQFHPEKSGTVGLRLLKNILKRTNEQTFAERSFGERSFGKRSPKG